MQKHENIASCLAELGNTHRLAIFRYLVKSGTEGAIVGDIQQKLNIPNSTLSHHLSRMVNVGLIDQKKEGRIVRCIPVYTKLDEIINFLKEECCLGY